MVAGDPLGALRRLLLGGALALLAGGCGPIHYTSNIIAAETALEEARDGNARRQAAYEFYSAEVYLEKAREEAAEGQYEDAIRFADAATSYAQQALQVAMRKDGDDG